VRIDNGNIFDPRTRRKRRPLQRRERDSHSNARAVVRRQLLFKPGERVTVASSKKPSA